MHSISDHIYIYIKGSTLEQLVHPSDIILRALFNKVIIPHRLSSWLKPGLTVFFCQYPEAEVAIVHDDEWLSSIVTVVFLFPWLWKLTAAIQGEGRFDNQTLLNRIMQHYKPAIISGLAISFYF